MQVEHFGLNARTDMNVKFKVIWEVTLSPFVIPDVSKNHNAFIFRVKQAVIGLLEPVNCLIAELHLVSSLLYWTRILNNFGP
jgi:hypothetical protein